MIKTSMKKEKGRAAMMKWHGMEYKRECMNKWLFNQVFPMK
jgi:hypothetical protein